MKSTVLCFLLASAIDASGQSTTRQADAPFSIVGENWRAKMELSSVRSVDEGLVALTDVRTAASFPDGSVEVASANNAAIVKYDVMGRQTREFGRWGKGPFEYGRPKVLLVHRDTLFVWDADNLKFILFDRDGRAIREYRGFSSSLSDFSVDSNFIAGMRSGGYQDSLLFTYLRTTGEMNYFGRADVKHLALSLAEVGGRLVSSGGRNSIVYSLASQHGVHFLDTMTGRTRYVAIPEPAFETTSIVFRDQEAIQRAMRDGTIYDALVSSSRVLGVFELGSSIALVSEHGKLRLVGRELLDRENRFMRISILNASGAVIDRITIPDRLRQEIGYYIIGAVGRARHTHFLWKWVSLFALRIVKNDHCVLQSRPSG